MEPTGKRPKTVEQLAVWEDGVRDGEELATEMANACLARPTGEPATEVCPECDRHLGKRDCPECGGSGRVKAHSPAKPGGEAG